MELSPSGSLDAILRNMDGRAYALGERIAKLHDGMEKAGLLETFRAVLRSDLLQIFATMGHGEGRNSSRELLALVCLDCGVVQRVRLQDRIRSQGVEHARSTSEFLEREIQRQREKIAEHSTKLGIQLPRWMDQFESNPELASLLGELARGLYSYFGLVVRLDGTITNQELSGFREFWDAYRPLKDAASPSPGFDGMHDGATGLHQPESDDRQIPAQPSAPQIRAQSQTASAIPERDWISLPSSSVETRPPTDEEREKILGEALRELDSLTGLSDVKVEVRKLSNLLKIQILRRQRGLAEIPVARHVVFAGNPGTGKTTVARIYARILQGLGLLSKGHLVEVDRAGLVAGYMGQTAEKVDAIVQRALDGVLFIDEAYSLVGEDESDYGHEAVATLLARMENFRDRLVVVAAGYTDQMLGFLDSNPGLRSRFGRVWNFPDYSAWEMTAIFRALCTKHQIELHPDAGLSLESRFERISQDPKAGNARGIRNLFEHAISRQADRLATLATITDSDLRTLRREDLAEI